MGAAFRQVVQLQLDQYSPEVARVKHIAIARAGLSKYLSLQEAPPQVMIETDRHPASSEDQVQPFGIITYRFLRMREIAEYAITEARRLSPVDSGDYQKAWFFMVDGTEVTLDAIKPNSTVLLTNDQPYSRKINVGARGFEKYLVNGAGVVEQVRQLVQRKYRALVDVNIEYIELSGGWVLRNHLRQIHKGRRYGGPRNDAREGMPITYPTLQIAPRV